jgi:hypothetical protein
MRVINSDRFVVACGEAESESESAADTSVVAITTPSTTAIPNDGDLRMTANTLATERLL